MPLFDLADDPWPLNRPDIAEQVYCGIDTAATIGLFEELLKRHTPESVRVYNFERAMIGPALSMMRRGCLIDLNERVALERHFLAREERCRAAIDLMAEEIWGAPLNPHSPAQKKELLYTSLQLKPRFNFAGGERKITTDDNTLKEIAEAEPLLRELCLLMSAAAKARKMLGAIRAPIDPDGRMRFSYNVGATETGRWSSSKNPFGRGTNGQNLTNRVRRMFVADPGKVLIGADLAGAESVVVGGIAGDALYLEAALNPELKIHTAAVRMAWPNLDWSGPPSTWKKIAEQMFDDLHDYYYYGKRLGHATNYLGNPNGLAKRVGLPVRTIIEFQKNYLGGFKGIRAWQQRVIRQVFEEGSMTTLLGRKRQFLGRRSDTATHREAIANEPQSIIGDLLNVGLWHVWSQLELQEKLVELWAQLHDGFYFQVDEDRAEEVVPRVQELAEQPIYFPLHDRTVTIPIEFKYGWCWEELSETSSPDGLSTWRGRLERTRQIAPRDILDRPLC